MDFKKTINQTLAIKMNRKQFLVHAGAALLAVVGVGAILQTLSKAGLAHTGTAEKPSASRSSGGAYGQSSYGS